MPAYAVRVIHVDAGGRRRRLHLLTGSVSAAIDQVLQLYGDARVLSACRLVPAFRRKHP